jgi:hypothetical protein
LSGGVRRSMAIAQYHFRWRRHSGTPLSLRERALTIDHDSRISLRAPFERVRAIERAIVSDLPAFGYNPLNATCRHMPGATARGFDHAALHGRAFAKMLSSVFLRACWRGIPHSQTHPMVSTEKTPSTRPIYMFKIYYIKCKL